MTNYKIQNRTEHFSKTTVEQLNDNLAALRLLKKLEQEDRSATNAEQTVLSKYVGWGGLANLVFDELNKRFEKERLELKELLTPAEYDSAKASSLTAYYSDPTVARAMWDKLVQEGFKGGNILDPSMGTGVFFMTMPEFLRANSRLYGVELDTVTGAIAKYLFPEATILVQGFETVDFNSESFDLIISNIPFADLRISHKNYKNTYYIHDFFIKHSISLLKHKGALAVITSTGTVDKRTNNILKEIKDEVHFKGGLRLPNTAFKEQAGTDVTSDILYFQRDTLKEPNGSYYFVEHSKLYEEVALFENDVTDKKIFVNPFFLDNRFVLGDYKVSTFRGGSLTVVPNSDRTIAEQIENGMNEFYSFFDLSQLSTDENQSVIAAEVVNSSGISKELQASMRMNEFAVDNNGVVYYKDRSGIRQSSKIEEIKFFTDENKEFVKYHQQHNEKVIAAFEKRVAEDQNVIVSTFYDKTPSKRGQNEGLYSATHFYEKPLNEAENVRIRGLIRIKEVYLDLINLQRTSSYEIELFNQLLQDLNLAYDSFVQKFGYINSRSNANLFDCDDRYSLIASLEDEILDPNDSKKVVYRKSEAFRKPTIRPQVEFSKVDNARDALLTSISEGRGVDFDLMTSLYVGSTKESIIEELAGEIYIDIETLVSTGKVTYVGKHDFLSGDILSKLEALEKGKRDYPEVCEWASYQTDLELAKPEWVNLVDINYNLSSQWIPEIVLGKFFYHFFLEDNNVDEDDCNNLIIRDKIAGTIFTRLANDRFKYSSVSRRLGLKTEDGSRNKYEYAFDIVAYMLNGDQPTINKNVGDMNTPKYETDSVATTNLREIEREISEAFKSFVEKDEKVGQLLAETYNETYNRVVAKQYDGSQLVVDGLAKNIEFRPHQKDAIQRIIEEKRALLAHEVGTGKTLTMLGAGFKLKELGLINKPLYVVPTSLTAQFGQEIMKFFPTKNVFVTTKKDFEKSRRRRFIARIATGDYDAIVIGDSQFEKMIVSQERQKAFLKEKIEELEYSISLIKKKGNSFSVKKIEGMKRRLETRLSKLDHFYEKDDFIEFEQLGIDMLFVDEAHHFKNVRPTTKFNNVVGIGQVTAKKNLDMEMKVRAIQEEHNYQNVVFATGTPVSNSISEMFIMMNYVQPDVLAKFKVGYFDAWVGAFGLIENSLELSPTGDKYISRLRFKKFVNLPELMMIYRNTTDIQLSENLDLQLPRVRRFALKTELTEHQKLYLDELVKRTELIKNGSVDPSNDNMLKITSEARKLALDMRLLDSEHYSITDSHKIMQVVDKVEEIYHKETEHKGTQMIFSDLGTPSGSDKEFVLYEEIKRLLVERDIPAEHIAFVHDADTEQKKVQLSRKMNVGEVRILLASTEKGGTGLNVQKRMKAVHHLDVPWKPSDIIQRNGRLVRQGNIYKTVDIYHYITKGSFDNYLWQIQETKLHYISQIMTAKSPVRAAEDIDEQTMTASDFKAIATGNPYLKLQLELSNEKDLLESQFKSWKRSSEHYAYLVKSAKEQLPILQERISKVSRDIETADLFSKDKVKFSVDFGDKTVDRRDLACNELVYRMQNNFSDSARVVILAEYRGFKLRMLSMSANTLIPGQFLTLNVVGRNQYPVQIDTEKPGSVFQRIDNVISGLNSKLKEFKKDADKKQEIIERGEVEAFTKLDRLNYVTAKYDVLTPLILKEEEAEIIENVLADFDESYSKNHSGYEVVEESASVVSIESLDENANNDEYEDGVWEEIEEEVEVDEFVPESITSITLTNKAGNGTPIQSITTSEDVEVEEVKKPKSISHEFEVAVQAFLDLLGDFELNVEDEEALFEKSDVEICFEQMSLF